VIATNVSRTGDVMSRLAYKTVKKRFEDRGFALVSTEYVDCMTKLDYICTEGHQSTTTVSSLGSGAGCLRCYQLSQTLTTEYVRSELSIEGYKLLEDYTSQKVKFSIECPEGHSTKITWNHFQGGGRCSTCSTHPGLYSEERFISNQELASKSGTLYSFKFEYKGSFYKKVGITNNWSSRKYDYRKLKIYDVRLQDRTLHEAFRIEQRYFRKYSSLRYKFPDKSLGGWTEIIKL
jgi:hypothetical protein